MLGIYGCYDENNQLMYVGSSGKTIDTLEYNHRVGGDSITHFRKHLRSIGNNWTFQWIQQPRSISRLQGEIEEGAVIRLLNPKYNQSKYPYERSVYAGRMQQV